MEATLEKLLTPSEVAAQLRLKDFTVRQMCRDRRIKAVWLSSRCIRIPQSELDRILRGGKLATAHCDEQEPRLWADVTELLSRCGALNGPRIAAGIGLRWNTYTQSNLSRMVRAGRLAKVGEVYDVA